MKSFHSYIHVERFGTDEVEGIEFGKCFIFPKVDGTNSQLWLADGELKAGSRNRTLGFDKEDNAGFYAWALQQQKLKDYLTKHPTHRIYGEWLVPHTLRTYREETWRRLWIFDVTTEVGDHEEFIPYNLYQPMLEEFGLDYIQPISEIVNPSYDFLIEQLERNTFLIQDGKGVGEGVVIKNYCVSINHRILTADLQWKTAGTMKVGDKLIGITDNNIGIKKGRYFCPSEVTFAQEDTEDCYELLLSDGTKLISTKEHPWLVVPKIPKSRLIPSTSYDWVKTENIREGQLITRLVPTWEYKPDHDIGWLSGFLDGEGSLIHNQPSLRSANLVVVGNQLSGPIAEKYKRLVKEKGFNLHEIKPGNSTAERMTIQGGKREAMRFLGMIRPERLLSKINTSALGGIKSRNKQFLTIVKKTFVDKQKIMRMSTSSGTYIAEGFGAHNSYYNQYHRQTWAKIVRQEFKEQNQKVFGGGAVLGKKMVEEDLVEIFCTQSLIDKTYAKIVLERDGWKSEAIPQLLNSVFHDLVQEDIWTIVKRMKNPTINFKTLQSLVTQKIKQAKPEIFN